MQKILQLISLTFIVISASSCLERKETIKPLAQIKTIAEIQKEAMMQQALESAGNTELSEAAKATLEESKNDPTLFYLNIKYNITDLDLFESINIENSYEIVSNSLLRAFAQLFLRLTGPRDIDLDNFSVPMPDLNLDLGIVKSIKIKRVYFEYNKEFDRSVGNKASFSFIDSLIISKKTPADFSFRYQKNNRCNYKCIEFEIGDADFTKEILSQKGLSLRPDLTITTIPKVTEMRLDGSVEMQIGLRLPF